MNTFLHLPTLREQTEALRHWRAHLADGGLLLIDVFHPDVAELAGLDGRLELQHAWRDPDTGHAISKFISRTVDPAEQTLHVDCLYDELDASGLVRRSVAPFDLRYIWRFEAELLLKTAGYALEAVYGDWDMGPFTGDSPRMILVARRKGA